MWRRIASVQKFLFKLALMVVEFDKGKLGSIHKIEIKEKMKDGSIITKTISDREEFLEILFLPLKEFEEKYIDLIDENGIEYKNEKLLDYRKAVHKKYRKMTRRAIILFILGYLISLSSDVVASYIPIIK